MANIFGGNSILISEILLVLLFISSSYQISTPQDPTYVAGVVEFKEDVTGTTPQAHTENNLNAFREIIQSPQAQSIDIIVFPEGVLNNRATATFVPDPKDKISPCDEDVENYENFFWVLSCLAKAKRKYLVVNLVEKSICHSENSKQNDTRPCSPDNLNKFNTNIVFDRSGAVISRYRKWNLYVEPGMNTTLEPELGIFQTDFGVKFGHFICFDILFYTPAQQLVKSGITDFVFTTKWFSELPFLTATQTQQAWAFGNDVNLLAAGASNPSRGSTGTGIYTGKQGAIFTVMASRPQTQLYIATIPKKQNNISRAGGIFMNNQPGFHELAKYPQMDNEKNQQQLDGSEEPQQEYRAAMYRQGTDIKLLQQDLDKFASRLVSPNDLDVNDKICSGELCCNFIIKKIPAKTSETQISYYYRMMVYSGKRTYQQTRESWIKVCAVVACTDETAATCGYTFDNKQDVNNNFIFEDISISGEFKNTNKVLIMPTTVDDALKPLQPTNYDFIVNEKDSTVNDVKFNLKTPHARILTFGIYANYYENPNGSFSLMSSSKFYLITFSLFITYLMGKQI